MIAFVLTFLAGGVAGWIIGSGNAENAKRWIVAGIVTATAVATAAWEQIQQIFN